MATVILHTLIGTWYLPFGFPVTMSGNHQALGIDFDLNMLFSNKIPDAAPTQTHGVYSNDMLTICKFNDMVAEACQDAQLFETINKLYCKYQFTTNDHNTLKQVDNTLTSILTDADQKFLGSTHTCGLQPYIMHSTWSTNTGHWD